jgi:hypothetical protein
MKPRPLVQAFIFARVGQRTCVDSIPIPKHLVGDHELVLERPTLGKLRTEILQVSPPMSMPLMPVIEAIAADAVLVAEDVIVMPGISILIVADNSDSELVS